MAQKFPAYGNRRFITPLTSDRHLSVSWTKDQSKFEALWNVWF